MMLYMEPPQHTRPRGFVGRRFTPRMIGRLEGHVTRICSSLIEDVAQRGQADFAPTSRRRCRRR
jgi:cholest-4-en-3-one 26-monooxygenase